MYPSSVLRLSTGALIGVLALVTGLSATAASAAGTYPTLAYIAVSRTGNAVYVNALVKQATSSSSIVRSPGRTVYVQRQVSPGAPWEPIVPRTTDTNGQFTVGFVQPKDYTYRLYVAAGDSALPAFSGTAKTVSPPKAATQAYLSGSRSGGVVYLNAMVKQGSGGSIVRSANRTVYVQRTTSAGWQTISTQHSNAKGQFTIGFLQPARGTYRLYAAASAGASAAYSGSVSLAAFDYDCGNFATHAHAQTVFNQYYPSFGDVFRLDSDNDLLACETLP